MGGLINSPNDDYINYISVGKDELVMTRKQPIRVDQFNRVIYKEGFYQASKEKDEWLEPDTLKLGWDEGLNLGGMNISVDGRKMYFTGCNWPGGFGSCDLYVSFKSGDKWEQPSNLGTRVNSQWWDSQPFISSNGKQLLFASKRAGGKGNTDIWMSVRQPGGKWSMPINLGDSINTPGSEMAPFLHPDGMTLYFASDGHDGLGGYDLFVSRKDETGRWSKAMNLGYPVNSMKNEINMVVDLHGESAWLSSDREGGEGKTDIYFFETYEAIKPQQVSFVKGQVLDEVTRRPLQAFVELSNLATGLNEDSTFTDRINGGFLMVLDPGLNYAFNIYAEGYMLYSENFNLDRDTADAVEKVFLLKPITAGERITLENVYFDFNSASLLPASFIELDKLSALLKDQPSMRIRIEGHTDDTGTDDYNQKLSEDRAGSVYHYLIENGVGPDRLEWVGFGASRPLTSNSSESGRAKNRRTEIVVL
jgi:outer membrane protein OmpA-like peptidoglycan-associated protein